MESIAFNGLTCRSLNIVPQPNNLSHLYATLNGGVVPSNKNHYLFFLGTDVVFTPRPTAPERSYIRGELFSYLAKTVSTLLEEHGEPLKTSRNNALAFSTPSVQVLNGPSTFGSEVGSRIAQGLLLALEAVANGKETLQFTGHSRGAVEVILVLHELERIKETLEKSPEKSLKEILIDSPCKYTRAALVKLFPSNDAEDTATNRAFLLSRLQALKTHAVLIDAVPGDIAGIGWHDPRFYKPIPCDKYEYLVCRDERTSGFYPIIAGEAIVIPGHHGTIPGNMFTQGYAKLPEELRHYEVSSVQDLALCKWFHFVNQTTGAFLAADKIHAPLNLEHQELDKVLNTYLAANEQQRNQILLDHYLSVAKNDPAYRYFAEHTHYPWLFREYAEGNYRYIHFHNDDYTSARDAFPDIRNADIDPYTITTVEDYNVVVRKPGSRFVNLDHVKLYLEQYLSLSQTKESDVKVVALTALVDNLLIEMRSDDVNAHGLLAIVSREADRHVFFNALSIFVDSISQKYLSEQLSNSEKAGLFPLISIPFSLLAAAKDEGLIEEYTPILIQIEEILQHGLKHAIETQYHLTLLETEVMFQDLQSVLNPESCNKKLEEFLSGLTIEDDLLVVLSGIKAHLLQQHLQTPEAIQAALSAELEAIAQDRSFDTVQKNKLLSAMSGEGYSAFKNYLQAKQRSIGEYLTGMERLHNKLEWIGENFVQLRALVGDKSMDVDLVHQQEKCSRLAQLAGRLLISTGQDVRDKPTELSAEFYTKVRNQFPGTSYVSYIGNVLYAPVAAAASAAHYVGSFFHYTASPKPLSDRTPTETPGAKT